MMRHGKDLLRLTKKQQQIIRAFNKLWHESIDGTWHKCYWQGIKVIKCPFDLWIYQELIASIRPGLIIETGTCFGGSALFMADMCKLIGRGEVITIDIKKVVGLRHRRLEYFHGNSVAEQTVDYVKAKMSQIKGPVMVILDSNHRKEHVLKELELYSQFVTIGSYLIVEDTNLNNIVRQDHGPGSREALQEWLPKNRRFRVDHGCQKFYATFNPGGYLKCMR